MSKTILITGTSTGFGHLTALKLADHGHRVFASMRSPNSKNSAHAQELESRGISVIELDVADNDSIQRAVKHISEQTGGLDVLVNNAGIAAAGISEAFTDDQVKTLFDINVIGVHRLTRAVLPIMRERQSGLIINIGSILGRVTFPFFGIYGASKYALEALTDSYRYELSKTGIDVVLLQPGAYPTSMYSSAQQPSELDRAEQYGDVASIPGAMFENFMEMFEAEDAPNPIDIASNISFLVDQPRGERPQRVVVGASFGADEINEITAPIQRNTIEALGLGHLS